MAKAAAAEQSHARKTIRQMQHFDEFPQAMGAARNPDGLIKPPGGPLMIICRRMCLQCCSMCWNKQGSAKYTGLATVW
jgi:hypothetical protein